VNPWRGLAGLPRRLWLLCGCTLVNRMGTMAYPFLALFLVQGRHWSPQRAGTAMLVYGAGGLLSAPFSGQLADRVGHSRILRLSLWGSGTMLVLLPLAGDSVLLLPAIFLWAALTQAFWPSSMALLTGLAPPGKRRAVFALHRLVSNLGMALGPALGGVIAAHSFRWVFWADGLTTLASALLLSLFFQAGAEERSEQPASAAARLGGAWRDRRLLLLLFGFLPALLVFCQMSGVLPLHLVRDLGFSSRFYGLVFTVNTLLIVLLEVALNLAMAHSPHHRQFALGAALIAVGFGLTGLAHGGGPLLATVVVWTFGEMILLPAMSDAVASLAPEHRRGEYMGMYSLTFAVGMALGPWLGVLIYAHAGARPVWLLCLLVGLGSATALSRFRLHPPEPVLPREV
jgi:predicted MFS family arabinose efflux permease